MGSKVGESKTNAESYHHPCIIVHGGAYSIPDYFKEPYLKGVQVAALEGYKSLMKDGSALDGVEAAVRSLEGNPSFNCGHGSVITRDGTVEADAAVMDGDTFKAGAVASVSGVAHPVSLAREVMKQTPHCLLVGDGALKFAKKIGFPLLENPLELITVESRAKCLSAEFENYLKPIANMVDTQEARELAAKLFHKDVKPKDLEHDTVGAVAMDRHGRIAAATSTGGRRMKMAGRVGDAPLIGSGLYANQTGGVSTSGEGESIMKCVLSREVVRFIEAGDSTSRACYNAMKIMSEKVGGTGGVIAISREGLCGQAFNTARMAWASVKQNLVTFGIEPGEEQNRTIENEVQVEK